MNKERIEQILSQAKESVKVLEQLQKQGLSQARKNLSKDNLMKNMKKLGFATKDDVRELSERIDDLASELRSQISKLNRKS